MAKTTFDYSGRKPMGRHLPSKRVDITNGGEKEKSTPGPMQAPPPNNINGPHKLKMGAKQNVPENYKYKGDEKFTPVGPSKIEKTKKIG